MPQENQVTSEAVVENVTENVVQEVAQNEHIAESKKYRKRAQDAEIRLAKLEKSLARAEDDKLKEKEEFKTLYEKASSDLEGLSANADKWSKYEEVKRNSLLENHPEDERESLSKLDLETLEYVTTKINNVKPNAPEIVGSSKNTQIKKDFSKMDAQEKRDNWSDILKSFK